MVCEKCGKLTKKSYAGMCQGCYKYFKSGGIVHELPPAGVIAYDGEGSVICHICGRAYKKLGAHARESHAMTIAEYKMEFGLCNNAKTTEQSYSDKMRELALLNKMDKQLLIVGEQTRIKKGETDKRKNKKARLQECLNKRKVV